MKTYSCLRFSCLIRLWVWSKEAFLYDSGQISQVNF